ncbi:thiamine phosphate synthase [Paenibacillus tritici]|uniref:thiamine phosphate synthase n=1 Tax=Paenibacillus tritici TaxID=1873425 RepID=UPI001BA77CBB|nr:thiamine phosphate synthase [Paenibacillus tritici]QUL56787.1 thiamine phosphate synthase [Paenibacillus tritici]
MERKRGAKALHELHVISDGRLHPEALAELAAAVHPMVDYIHLREKSLSARELLAAAGMLLQAGIPPAKLVINDRVDVALAVGAAGAQLAWHSLPPAGVRGIAPGLRLGRSVHSREEAAEAGRQGADFCLYGHVFPTACKPGQQERGLEQLAEAVRWSRIPLIALGGITPDNAGAVLAKGAAGIAVMSGICGAPDPAAAARAYRAAVHQAAAQAEALNIVPAPGEGGEQA